MSTQQQQQNSQVLPTLEDLDKPIAQQQQQQSQETQQQQQQQPSVDPNNPPAPKEDEVKEDPNQQQQQQPADDDTGEEEDSDPQSFYDEVTKLRGDNFQFTFPDGVEPDSPQGLHHAIQMAVDHEIDNFESNLMRTDPRAYSYMLHRNNGGSDEEFFSNKTEVLPEWDVLKNSVDLQQQFYKRVLTRKEIEPDQIDFIIKNAVEKNRLSALVEGEYNRLKKSDEDQAREMLRINQENQERYNQMVNKMGTTLKERIIENKGLGITIPDAKRGEFLQYVNQLLSVDARSGQWYIQQELNAENMNNLLEALYYMKVGGNLDEIIKNKADQQNVKRLRMGMQKDKTKKSTQPDPNKQTVNKPGVQPALTEL